MWGLRIPPKFVILNVVCAAICVVSDPPLAVADAKQLTPFYGALKGDSKNTSLEPVRINLHSPRFGETHWKIPKAYLIHEEQRRSGRHSFATLVLDAENMEPWAISESVHGKRQSGLRLHNDYVWLEIRTANRLVKYRLTQNARSIGAPGNLVGEGKSVIGTKRYKKFNNNSGTTEYFLPDYNIDSDLYYIKCSANNKKIGRCTVVSDAGSDVYIKYIFSRSYLENWRNLDHKIKSLLANFRVNDPPDLQSDPKG